MWEFVAHFGFCTVGQTKPDIWTSWTVGSCFIHVWIKQLFSKGEPMRKTINWKAWNRIPVPRAEAGPKLLTPWAACSVDTCVFGVGADVGEGRWGPSPLGVRRPAPRRNVGEHENTMLGACAHGSLPSTGPASFSSYFRKEWTRWIIFFTFPRVFLKLLNNTTFLPAALQIVCNLRRNADLPKWTQT